MSRSARDESDLRVTRAISRVAREESDLRVTRAFSPGRRGGGTDKGVGSAGARSPTPPALDERMEARRPTSGNERDLDGVGYLPARGRRITPLAHAIANDPIHMGDPVHTVAMATKFPPEFLQAVEEQSVMSGIGGDVEIDTTDGGRRELCMNPTITASPQPGGFQDLLESEFPASPDLDTTAIKIRGFLAQGARQADEARRAFDTELHNFRVEREEIQDEMRLLHADRVDPRSIEGIVEDSIASRLRAINEDMLGVVHTLASIRDVQKLSAERYAEINASRRTQMDELHATLSSQHSTLMKMAEGNQVRDAQLVKQSERLDRMEVLFDRMDAQLPKMSRCVELCSEVASSSSGIASTLTTIRDQTVTTAQTVSQRLDGMEDTIRDTFVDLKVEVITATLTSLEHKMATRFTAVDEALAQLASPPLPATPPSPPSEPAPPVSTTPADVDNADATPTPTRLTGDAVTDAASYPPRFNAHPTFNPGSAFPPGNRVSHMNPRVAVEDNGGWRQRDDAEDHTRPPSRCEHRDTTSDNFRAGRPFHSSSPRHLREEADVDASHQETRHRGDGRRDMRTDTHRDHRWSLDDRTDDDDDEGYATMGGPIKSPSNMERFRQARQRGMSRYDSAALADKDYHGGVRGFDPLTIRHIKNCGYTAINSDDILLCYRDIIHLHRRTLDGWTNMRTQQQGPSVERIMEKAMPLFKKLDGITMTDLVQFYDSFQKTGSVYLLPVMPFDAVNLKLGFEGLCPPGLGVDRYASIAAAIMEVIPRLLPDHTARLTTTLATVRGDSNNGFDLLWRLMALAVPGFDPAQHVSAPVWVDYRDIFDFCHAHVLYFRLQAKRGLYYDDRTRSSTFLRAIQQPEYIEVVTTLQTHIESYQDMDMGYLPPSLCMMELATRIDRNATARVSQYGMPRANRIFGVGDYADDDESVMPMVQGYAPSVFRIDGDQRGRNIRRQDFGDKRYSGGPPSGARNGTGNREARGRYARPDHNRRKYDPAIICDACKRRGHPAAQCDLLAQAIFINKYMKHSLTDIARGKLEEAWLQRWKEKLGHPNRTPGKVLRAYLDNMDMPIDDLDHQMCWDCWPSDDDVEVFPELSQE